MELPKDIFPEFSPLRQNLRFRLVMVATGPILMILFLAILLNLVHLNNLTFILILVLAGVALTGLVSLISWMSLKPLEKIYWGLNVLGKGELNHIVNQDSQDELGDIARSINLLSKALSTNLAQVTSDKEFSNIEKNKLELILSALKDGIIVLDLHKNIVLLNQEAQRLLGCTLEEVKGQNIDQIVNLTNRASAQVLAKEYSSNSNIPLFLTLLSKVGSKIPVNVSSAAIETTVQTDLGCLVIIKDISRQKNLDNMQLDFVSMASH